MARVSKLSKAEQLRWQAEDVVREAIKNTPSYEKAVRQTIRHLKETQNIARNTLRGNKKK